MAIGTHNGGAGAQPVYLQARQSANTAWNLALNPLGGNVGIGTTAPGAALDIYGTALTSFTGTARGLMDLNSSYTGTNISALDFLYSGNLNPVARIGALVTGSGTYLQFGTSNNYVSGITNTAMTIDYNGNVGIGTTSPGNLLDVVAASNPILGVGQSNYAAWPGSDTRVAGINLYNQRANGDKFVGLNAVVRAGQYMPSLYIATNSSYTTTPPTRFVLTESGNVGIGTTGPVTALQVNGTITAGNVAATNGPVILQGNYSGSSMLSVWGSEYATGGPIMGYGVDPSTSASASFLSSASNASLARAAITANGGITFYTGPGQTVAIGSAVTMSPVMTILNGGNVGIGTTSPQSPLQVVEAGKPTTSGYMATGVIIGSDTGGPALNIGAYDSGVGSTSYSWLSSAYHNSAGASLPFALQPNGGNVGIGTTAPGAKLDVNGGINIAAGNTISGQSGRIIMAAENTGNVAQFATYGLYLPQYNSGGYSLYVGGGIDQGYAGAANSYFNGSMTATGTITAQSDRRLKQNIKPLTGTLSKLDQLRGVSFEWNKVSTSMGHKEGEKGIGMIAQELQKVYPELVVASKNEHQDYLSIDYMKFTAVLLQAIKEQQKEIEELQRKLGAGK